MCMVFETCSKDQDYIGEHWFVHRTQIIIVYSCVKVFKTLMSDLECQSFEGESFEWEFWLWKLWIKMSGKLFDLCLAWFLRFANEVLRHLHSCHRACNWSRYIEVKQTNTKSLQMIQSMHGLWCALFHVLVYNMGLF